MSDGAAVLILPKLLLGISAPNTPVAGDGTANLTLPPLSILASGQIPVLPAITLTANGVTGTNNSVTQQSFTLGKLLLTGEGLTGSLATASMTLPVMSLDAHSVSYSRLFLPSLNGTANGTTGTNGKVSQQLPALLMAGNGNGQNPGQLSRPVAAFVLLANGGGGSSGSLARSLRKWTATATGAAGTTGSTSEALPSLTVSGKGAGPAIGSAALTLPMLMLMANGQGPASSYSATDSTVLALNANTIGLTSYNNFPFNSMTVFNGVSLAAGDNGIYAMGGTLDDTADITTKLKLGIFDFASDKLKRVDALYFAYRANGDLTVRVTLDDNEQVEYTLEATGQDGIYTNRLKMGKGMKARYWQAEVEGVGVDFVLDSIDPKPQELSRRI